MRSFLQKLFIATFVTSSILGGLAIAQTQGKDNGEAVFEVLASEIALQRGEAGLAYNTYLEMARQYRDPKGDGNCHCR
jgi:hypothetical protein